MGRTMEDQETMPEPEEPEPGSVTPPPSPEIEEEKKRFEELNNRFLRLAADFDNFRKRTTRDHEDQVRRANERFAVDILEVVDNFDRALKADDDHLRQGVEQIRQLLGGILERHGISPIDALKKSFDPGVHEAVAHLTSPEAEGTVIDVVSPGYRMHDKVLRYAKVAVSKGTESHERTDV